MALSAHIALEERLEDLRENGSVTIARLVCEDDTNPPALRLAALEMLDGSILNQDLSLALACSVETCPFRESAIQVARGFVSMKESFAAEYLIWLTNEIKTNPNKYLLQAIWGLSSVDNIKLDASHVDTNVLVEMIDLLAGIAGEEFLQVSNKRELMGSWNVKVLGTLGLISLGTKLTNPVWFKLALHRYLDFSKLRSLAIVCLMRENIGVSIDVKALLVCESIEHIILQDTTLKTWNQLWFWKTDPTKDEQAAKLVEYSHYFARCTLPLLHWLQQNLHGLDEAVQLKICLLAYSLVKGQIDLPWKTREMCEIANGIISQRQNTVWDLEEMRARLGKEQWKEDWIGTPALLYMCMQKESNVDFVCTRGDLEPHLLACLLPMVDDVDPRISAPAWQALTHCLRASKRLQLFPKHQALLLHTLERNLTTRDEAVFVQVCGFYQACFESNDNAPTAAWERKLVENLCNDAFYSAHSNAKLYNLAITLVLCGAIQRLHVDCIPLLDLILRAAEAGAQQRETNATALLLLESILAACEPRVRAHRGRIFALFLRLAVHNNTTSETLQHSFSSFMLAVHDNDWVSKQLDKVRKVNPDLTNKLIT